MIPFGCELLQKVYLCSNTNNLFQVRHVQLVVVNCFKKCIFAVIQTTRSLQGVNGKGCELLQKVYLCSNTNNSYIIPSGVNSVVNCFKKCIFAVIQTTFVYLISNAKSCELLQKVYLCSNTNNQLLMCLIN